MTPSQDDPGASLTAVLVGAAGATLSLAALTALAIWAPPVPPLWWWFALGVLSLTLSLLGLGLLGLLTRRRHRQ